MQIKVKVKRSDWKQDVEAFGNNMYLAYVISDSDGAALQELIHLLSKKLGVPPARIQLRSKNGQDLIFDLN